MSWLRREFAKRLKSLRIEKQLTQSELAKALGRSTSFVSSLERGIDAPSFETLESLSEVFGVPVRDLFDFENPHDTAGLSKRKKRRLSTS